MASSFFYYVTYKYVLLKDAKLGLLYYCLAIIISIFTIGEIFLKRGYMEFDTRPLGTLKLMLSDSLANETFNIDDLPYCKNKVPCVYLDPWDLNWPPESHAVTITTFSKDRIQFRLNHNGSTQTNYKNVEEKVYFTQSPEEVVIKVDHAVVASQFRDSAGKETVAASHRQLKGYLMDRRGDPIRELSIADGGSNRVTVRELLEAAGVKSLESKSDAIDAKGKSYRERGLILQVTIFYENWLSTWIGTGNIEYKYHVRRVPFINYVSKQVEALISPEQVISNVGTHTAPQRLLKKRYSVRIEFEQAGSLGQFSLPILLMKLVSGMGLLTLAATIIDGLALYVLPHRSKYRNWVYETPDLKKSD